jgi:hypothetical protein
VFNTPRWRWRDENTKRERDALAKMRRFKVAAFDTLMWVKGKPSC